MIFRPGNVHRFRPGTCPNPAGRAAGFPALRKQAVQEVMRVVDEILTDPANLQRWRQYVQERWTEDPGSFLREIVLPLSPRESLTLLRTTENGLAALTVTQLKAIAATLRDSAGEDAGEGEDKGNVIDADSEGTEAQGRGLPAVRPADFDPEAGF